MARAKCDVIGYEVTYARPKPRTAGGGRGAAGNKLHFRSRSVVILTGRADARREQRANPGSTVRAVVVCSKAGHRIVRRGRG